MKPLVINGKKHSVGETVCKSCQTAAVPCLCGGLVHTQLVEESRDDFSPIFDYKCDRCGDKYRFYQW